MPNTKQTIIDAVTMMRLDVLARIDSFFDRVQPLLKSAEQLISASPSIGGQINLIEGRIADLETARENHDERITNHYKRLGGMQKWIEDINEQLDGIKDRQDRLFRHHLDLELFINLLRKDICEIEQQIKVDHKVDHDDC